MTSPDPIQTPTLPLAVPQPFRPLLPIAMLLALGTVCGGVLFDERYSAWIRAAMALILTGVAPVN